jgi:GNAT superfamily N-acetyltransferase
MNRKEASQTDRKSMTVHRISELRVRDFFRLHHDDHECGWCCCVAWWVPAWDGWPERTADQNRILRQSLFDQGEYDGYLLYDGSDPVGWCQAGIRDRLQKLALSYGLTPDPEVWAITCFLIVPEYRGQGYTHFLLKEVIQDLRTKGVKRVQAFPKSGRNIHPGDAWTGPESLYLSAGFNVLHGHPDWPVLEMELELS